MKIVVASDSFKGSISSMEIANIIEREAMQIYDNCEVVKLPIADGGEGTMDSLVYMAKGRYEDVEVSDPIGRKIKVKYGIINKNTAVIELASASGLPLVVGKDRNPLVTSTYGTGEMIKIVLDKGYKKIILTIGGSATNDGGSGALEALGAVFYDENYHVIKAVGGTLDKIRYVDVEHIHPELANVEITIMCDVNNPLLGEKGATQVFGPQKGANKDDLIILENGLKNYVELLETIKTRNLRDIKGSGAAGGFSISLLAVANTKLESGIETVLDLIGFSDIVKNADLVITGEGRVDSQSVDGKVLSGIGESCKKYNVPVVAVVGGMGAGATEVYKCGITSIIPIINGFLEPDEAFANTKALLKDAVDRMFRLINIKL